MPIGRWFGDDLLSRYGRVAVIRGQAALAIAGVLVFVFSPVTALAFVGVLMWGLRAALVLGAPALPLASPAAMRPPAADPAAAAGRVSVVASIGYCAFLGGPPL